MITNLEKYSFPTKGSGLLLSSQDCTNGNMLGYTAQLLFLAKDRLTDEQYQSYMVGIWSCHLPTAWSRYPNNPENTSVDDYLALSCIPYLAKLLLSTAVDHLGFLDVKWPHVSFNAFIFRFQGLWQHMKVSAGINLGWLGKLIWAASIYMAAKEPFANQDSWIESHLMVLVKERAKISNPIMDAAVVYWRAKKGNMTTAEITAKYCNIPDHPLVQAWEPYK